MNLLKPYLWIVSLAVLMACEGRHSEKRQTLEEEGGHLETVNGDVVEEENGDKKTAMADISSASGSDLSGKAVFTEENDRIHFQLTVHNAKPGTHAVHIHEKGDCSAPDAKSAGGHWNPTNAKHGKRGEGEFHKGDIGNMEVDEEGHGSIEMSVEGWTIGGAEDSNILNKAVIIHAGADDFTSQPSGNAGDRVGCGVIQEKEQKPTQ